MKTNLKKIILFALIGVALISCDSSSDSVTPVVVPDTFNHLYIRTQNAPINSCNVWDFTEVFGTTPVGLKRNDTYSPASLGQQIQYSQCSAYCRDLIQGAKRYVVSTGERVVVYDASSNPTPTPIEFPVSGVQAMEFVNGRFFMVISNVLTEYDVFSMTAVPGFTPITLVTTSDISNMAFNGNFLYVIAADKLYKINTSGSGSISTGYPKPLLFPKYEGLEYVNNPTLVSPVNNSLIVVRKTATSNELVKIDESTGAETPIVLLTYPNGGPKISTVLDYTTEYYYIFSSDGWGLNTFTFTTIDLTPPSGLVSPTYSGPLTGFQFGYQLKD